MGQHLITKQPYSKLLVAICVIVVAGVLALVVSSVTSVVMQLVNG